MSSPIKSHPAYTFFMASAAVSKIVESDRWTSNKIANINFAKTLYKNSNMDFQTRIRLKMQIGANTALIKCVKSLSHYFTPVVFITGVLCLDNHLSKKSK